jgi:hypothetical protein
MKWAAPAIASGALICVFIVIAVSVVDARRPTDERVVRSYDATIVRLAGDRKDVTSTGCRRTRLFYYDCTAVLRRSLDGARVTVHWQLVLSGNDCWTATRKKPLGPASELGRLASQLDVLRGCAVD